ncbi:MAG: sigma-70 family RNA polymerase sigma factor [Thioalkalivibrionaceae bacterium]
MHGLWSLGSTDATLEGCSDVGVASSGPRLHPFDWLRTWSSRLTADGAPREPEVSGVPLGVAKGPLGESSGRYGAASAEVAMVDLAQGDGATAFAATSSSARAPEPSMAKTLTAETLVVETSGAKALMADSSRSTLSTSADCPGADDQAAVWVAAMVAGDDAAFRCLYDAMYARVWTVVLRVLGEPSAAEEIVADVFYEIWTQASSFDPTRGRVASWILVRARSRAIDHLRRERRWREMTRTSLDDPAIAALATRDQVADSDPDLETSPDGLLHAAGWGQGERRPDAELERSECVTRLDRALATLDTTTRSLIEKAFYEGWTHAELQDWSGLPLGTLKSKIRRGLARLRQTSEYDLEYGIQTGNGAGTGAGRDCDRSLRADSRTPVGVGTAGPGVTTTVLRTSGGAK